MKTHVYVYVYALVGFCGSVYLNSYASKFDCVGFCLPMMFQHSSSPMLSSSLLKKIYREEEYRYVRNKTKTDQSNGSRRIVTHTQHCIRLYEVSFKILSKFTSTSNCIIIETLARFVYTIHVSYYNKI